MSFLSDEKFTLILKLSAIPIPRSSKATMAVLFILSFIPLRFGSARAVSIQIFFTSGIRDILGITNSTTAVPNPEYSNSQGSARFCELNLKVIGSSASSFFDSWESFMVAFISCVRNMDE